MDDIEIKYQVCKYGYCRLHHKHVNSCNFCGYTAECLKARQLHRMLKLETDKKIVLGVPYRECNQT